VLLIKKNRKMKKINNKFNIGDNVTWFDKPCKVTGCDYSEWSGWYYDISIDDGGEQLRNVQGLEEEFLRIDYSK